jgi:hypothetical protein
VLYIGDKDERFEAIAGIFPFPVKRESELPEGSAAHLAWSDRSFFTNLNRFKCHEMPIPKWGEVHEAQYYLDFFGIEKNIRLRWWRSGAWHCAWVAMKS